MKPPAPFPAATWTAAGLTAAIFILDLLTPLGVAVWLLYLLPVFCASHSPRAGLPLAVAGVGTALIAVGFVMSPPGVALVFAILNRVLGTALLWAVAILLVRRNQAEQERRKFVLLAESSSEFIGICDLDLRPFYVNPAGVRMVGLPDLAAACRVKVQDYFFPEDQRFIAEEFFPRVMREGHGDVEIRLRHFQTGEPIWMFYYVFSVRDASGTAVGWATISRGITERKKSEAALRESEDRFSKAFHSSPVGLVISRAGDLRMVDVNGGLAAITGYAREELLGRTTLELGLVSAEAREQIAARLRDQGSARNVELTIRTKAGEARHCLCSAEAITLQGHPHFIGSFHDITERKKSEAALRESEARYRTLVEQAADGIFIVGLDGRLLQANSRARQMFGYTAEEFSGLPIAEVVSPADLARQTEEFRRLAAGERVFAERQFRRKDGSVFLGELTACRTEAGLFVAIARDITERKQAEAKIAQQLAELRRWYEATLGREDRVRQLKQEVNALRTRLGEPPPYPSQATPLKPPPP